ncbi:MAG: M20/M25/M40 family metallo-hydrolase [Bacteroidetes bacterium]|nr:MAG: M20/M25/M40 family metallo-hydrolase [Bacteroidota bacterium]
MILKIALISFLLSFLNQSLIAQNTGLKKIDVADLKRHLSVLSSDSLQGRAFGTTVPGLDLAADYLKKIVSELGLSAGDDCFFQTVPVISSKPDTENTFLEIADTLGRTLFKTDSVIGLPAGTGIDISNAEVVFAGFGWSDEKSGYDDFHGVDLHGKVVVFTTGTPESFRKRELSQWNNSLETAKIKKATEAGAALVIITDNQLEGHNSIYSRLNRWINRNDFSLPASDDKTESAGFVFANASFADFLLGGKGKFKKQLEKIAEKKHPQSFLIEKLRINVKVNRKTEHIQAKNIIGFIEGSHPELKNEYVVYMAHYDHLGIDAGGDVFNGADDNGSGTVTLLEVAEAFLSLTPKPKRSLVFLWVTAEEVGLLGSQYYAENPMFPMEKTVACINIDMSGRVFEPRDTVWNKSPKKVKDFDGLYALTNDFWPALKDINNEVCAKIGLIPDYSLPSNFLRSSDHYSFHSRGVPIINYSTGYHADYHKPTDEISRINFDKMKRVADLCFLVGLKIANGEGLKEIKIDNLN